MPKSLVTKEIQQEATAIIEAFNKNTFEDTQDFMYIPRFKGNFLYLDRKEFDKISPVARLKYTGDFKKWEFAIFKWTREDYDADEWWFPGSGLVDGTIEGAMKAGLEAYPL